MKQVRVHGAGDVRVDEIEDPTVSERDAVVAIAACGICGTDLKYIDLGFSGPGRTPMCLGHEMAGVVESIGSAVTNVAVGDRVVVHPGNDELGRIGSGATEGGLTPRLLVREAAGGGRLYPVPDHMDLTVAALTEPLAVGMHAVAQGEAGPGDKVVIFGSGPIGLASLATLVDLGNEQVIVVDMSERRLELARQLGAQLTVNPADGDVWERIYDRHGTTPYMFGPTAATDVYIEASGAASVIGDILAHARTNSRMSVVAVHMGDIPVSFLTVLSKQFTIRGSMEYPERFESAIELLQRTDLSPIITHRFELDDFGAALGVLSGSRECGKVMITIP